ncbi:MAG: hypothetical protein K9W44_03255 [Candidatus Lokiarchaeota archaeon]|nr:hypothetical protein [Candidatus Harpocratesius repetitus]
MVDETQAGSLPHQVKIQVPHRISGFFQMQDPDKSHEITSPLDIGSRGGGPALTAYGTTLIINDRKYQDQENPHTDYSAKRPNISVKDVPYARLPPESSNSQRENLQYRIIINQQDCTYNASTSITVLELMQSFLPPNSRISIIHNFDLPLGAGYGSSGAGALGIALGLNELFQLGLTPLEAAQYAHIAEVQNHTGLGTVAGQFTGGLALVLEPGYPFRMHEIEVPENISIGLASWGAISTKHILTDPEYKHLIFEKGQQAMTQMQKEWSLENYMKVCQDFVINTHLLEKLHLSEIAKVIEELNQVTQLGASLNQLGKSVFCFCTKDEREIVTSIMEKYRPSFGPKFVQVAKEGYNLIINN